ncbi:MAG: ABC transporter substrate-binding protein [Mogibacterium sp.]|nr:ABC transporter substrate-binding protein [Mogibacterium sp.]
MSRTWIMKKHAALAIAVLLLLSSVLMAGCAGKPGVSTPEGSSAAGTVVSETETEITVVDQAGREVAVARDPQSIALCYRVVIRFLINLDMGDRITGIGKSEPFLEEIQPSLKECTDVGKGVADIEALAELEPDLFIHKASDVETLEAVQKIGIPAIGISVETPEEMVTALDLLGKVCGAEEKAQKLIDHYQSSVARSRRLSDSISDEDRKTAIVMGSSIGKVADGSMLQGKMLETAGAVNCAADLKATELWPTAGAEQIFKWDPDFIFISGSESSVYTADDIYKDPAWSELKAVKNRHVVVIPSERDSWEFPGVISVLGIDYMMSVMYPELMSEKDLEDNVSAFYELAYGRSFSREELGY